MEILRFRTEDGKDPEIVASFACCRSSAYSAQHTLFAARAAGLDDWTPYEMRHSAVSLLAAAGVPIDQLADLAGHRDATTLLSVYRHDISPAVDAGAAVAANLFTPRAEGQ